MVFNLVDEMRRLEALYKIPNPTADQDTYPDAGPTGNPGGNQSGRIKTHDGKIVFVEMIRTSSDFYYLDSKGNVYTANAEGQVYQVTPDMAGSIDGSTLNSGEFEHIHTDVGDFYLRQSGVLYNMSGSTLLPVSNNAPFYNREFSILNPNLDGRAGTPIEQLWETVSTPQGLFWIDNKGNAYRNMPDGWHVPIGPHAPWGQYVSDYGSNPPVSIEEMFGTLPTNAGETIINLQGRDTTGTDRAPVFIRDAQPAPDGGTSTGNSEDVVRQGYTVFRQNDGSDYLVRTTRGTSGADQMEGSGWLMGLAGNDLLTSGSGSDTLSGGDGDDALLGGVGDDILIAGTGNNVLEGGKGADKLDGTGGWGVADYHRATTTAVTIHLDGSGNTGDEEAVGDQYINVNGVIGSNHADTLVGNNADNWMIGGLGNDVVSGSAGSDTLYGSEGDDTLIGGTGNDHLIAGSGNNILEGGAGADTLDGSDGWGVADYSHAATAVTVRLDGSGNAGDQAAGDHYINVNGAFGSAFGDNLVGNASANWIIAGGGNDLVQGAGGSDTLYGSEGDDSLDGGAGEDVLYGGAGQDLLTGGSGRDVFVFDANPAGSVDRIIDFSVAEDRIQLDRSVFSGFGASVKLTVGSMASSGAAEVLYNSGTGELSYDADGLGGGAAVKFAVLAPGLALQASHFFLV